MNLLGSQQSMATPSTSVFDSWMILNRKTLPPMPWNSGILKDPFAFPLKRPRLSPAVFGMQAAIAASPAGSSGSGPTVGPHCGATYAVSGLLEAAFENSQARGGKHFARSRFWYFSTRHHQN